MYIYIYYIMLCYTILHYIILYYTILYYTILHYIILYYIIRFFILIYNSILYFIILCICNMMNNIIEACVHCTLVAEQSSPQGRERPRRRPLRLLGREAAGEAQGLGPSQVAASRRQGSARWAPGPGLTWGECPKALMIFDMVNILIEFGCLMEIWGWWIWFRAFWIVLISKNLGFSWIWF